MLSNMLADVQVLRTSNLYQSQPMHVVEQPPFLNAAALMDTPLPAAELLKRIKSAEAAAGRDFAGQRWGPRPLDIDIIFHGGGACSTESLTLPHPRWKERPFVTLPICELRRKDGQDEWLQVCADARFQCQRFLVWNRFVSGADTSQGIIAVQPCASRHFTSPDVVNESGL